MLRILTFTLAAQGISGTTSFRRVTAKRRLADLVTSELLSQRNCRRTLADLEMCT